MDEKTIRETLLKGERVTLECKKAQSNVPVDAWKTYSAFANTYGGLILLGVYEDLKEKDISKRFTITGVDDAAKIRKDFWNIVNNQEKVNVNLLKDEDVETLELEGKIVMATLNKKAAETQRLSQYYFFSSFFSGSAFLAAGL